MEKILIEIDLKNFNIITKNILKVNTKESIYFYRKEQIDKKTIENYILNKKIEIIDSKYPFYTIIQFNKINKQIIINQDNQGDLQPIYYTYIKNKIIISNSLQDILIYLDNKKFNKKSLYYFLSCGFIPNENTLIKNVYKIIPGYINILKFMNKTLELKKKKFNVIKYNKPFNKEKYNKLLLDEIHKQSNSCKEYAMTISSGYDSNLLIALLNTKQKENIQYYSVGGSKGVDETTTAKKILKEYKNNDLHTSYVDSNTFSSFPEIVFLYEGLFYERGIFLQYELYKMLAKQNKNIVLGDGADQILHINYKNKYNIHKEIKKKDYSLYQHCPYEMLVYLVLKKSSLLLTNTSNHLVYPYLSNKFISYVDKIRNENGFDKKIHKNIVQNTVPQNVTPYLNKLGGATEQIALFKDDSEFLKWQNKALNSKYSSIKCERNTTELSQDIDYILKILYLMIFEQIFLKTNKFILNKELIKQYNIHDFI